MARRRKPRVLGPVGATAKGFPVIDFVDDHGRPCSLEMSTLADYPTPGVSALWLGTTLFELGPAVLAVPRMHLRRSQVIALRAHLTRWLRKGTF